MKSVAILVIISRSNCNDRTIFGIYSDACVAREHAEKHSLAHGCSSLNWNEFSNHSQFIAFNKNTRYQISEHYVQHE